MITLLPKSDRLDRRLNAFIGNITELEQVGDSEAVLPHNRQAKQGRTSYSDSLLQTSPHIRDRHYVTPRFVSR